MPNYNELIREASEQVLRRKQRTITAFVKDIETRVAANSELEEVLSEFAKMLLSKNGNKTTSPRKPKHRFAAGTEDEITSHRDQLRDWFELSDLQKIIEATTFQFNSSDHRKALRDALYRLEHNKKKIESEKPEGKPTRYRFV